MESPQNKKKNNLKKKNVAPPPCFIHSKGYQRQSAAEGGGRGSINYDDYDDADDDDDASQV